MNPALIQAGIALGQSVLGAIQAKKGRKQLEKEIAGMPKYQPSQGILDYYAQAQQRYGVSPAQTAMYKRQMQNIQRAGATGLAGAGGARGRMAAASSIARSMADATLGAEVAAEQQRAQRFGELGRAAQLKRGEEMTAFQQNLLAPSQMRLQMAAQRAAGGSQLANVGLSNLFGAAQSYGTQQLYKQYYGGGGTQYPKTSGITSGMVNLFPTPRTYQPTISSGSGLIPSSSPSAIRPR